jgi:hypothetical protein
MSEISGRRIVLRFGSITLKDVEIEVTSLAGEAEEIDKDDAEDDLAEVELPSASVEVGFAPSPPQRSDEFAASPDVIPDAIIFTASDPVFPDYYYDEEAENP